MSGTSDRRVRFLVSVGVMALLGAVLMPAASAVAAVPTTEMPPVYDAYPAVTDPGLTAPGYFQPFWYDTEGRHIQAHGGQIVTASELGVDAAGITSATEDGETVYYWYGEDRSNGYYDSPGVAVYRSTDTVNWTNEGVAMRSVTSTTDLESEYFDTLYDTVDDAGTPDTARIDELFYYLNVSRFEADGTTPRITAIFERPKVLYNAQTRKWVMWWHSDGSTTAGGSTYARSLAAVATSDSPTGPFALQGAYRLYNETSYKTACNQNGAVPGGARDMTVFQDTDGTAYVVYSSEENRSLYIAKLDSDYTNVEQTTTADPTGIQYSADGRYPKIFADGAEGAPVNHEDYAIVKRCGLLEAPALFVHDGRYYLVASGATGWRPNPQTYYTADSVLGTWIRGVEADDRYENVSYDTIPQGGDGLLSIGDSRKTSFGSQSTNVFTLDAAKGQYIYMGDRWNSGAADSTYVWLPMTIGENGRLEMRNPTAESPEWASGWDASYWDDKGAGRQIWSVADARLPASVQTNRDLGSVLPSSVAVRTDETVTDVAVTWSPTVFTAPGTQKIVGTLAEGDGFTAGRTFTRTITVEGHGLFNVAPDATAEASSRQSLAATTNDGAIAKGWDDWVSGGKHPLSSWLSYSWAEPRSLDHVVVHTYKDGSTATWPSKIAVRYRDAAGSWQSAGIEASVAQDASGAAPVVDLDVSALPATTALRLDLTTVTNTWQSVAEVEVFGYGASTATKLTELRVDGVAVDGFSPGTWNYTVVAKDPAARVVSATPADASSRVTVEQATTQRPFADVTVEALDSTHVVAAQTYRIGFVRPSTDATLTGITVNGAPLAGFDPATTDYPGLQLLPGTTPAVTAAATNANASVEVGAFDPSSNTVTVEVTAEDTAVTRAYRLGFVVDARSWDASLSGITVNGVAVPGVTPGDHAYTVDIGTWGSAPAVSATAAHPSATVSTSVGLSSATVTVAAENPAVTATYRLAFTAASCSSTGVQSPWVSAAWGTATNAVFCDGDGPSFRISDANDGAWTTKDNLSVVSRPDVLAVGESIEVFVPSVDQGDNTDPRAGLVVRNDLARTGKATAKGYALVVLSPTGGYLQYDSNNNGYIDTQTAAVPAATWPAYVKLERTSATSVTGYFRKATGDEWAKIATVPIAGANATLDAGVFAAGNNARGASVAHLLDVRFSFDVAWTEPVAVDTWAGAAPELPAELDLAFVDGTTDTRAVEWDAIDPGAYASAGAITVGGSIEGTEARADATVTVHPADGAGAPPAKAVLSSDNGWDTGLLDGEFRITMNLWWGDNASLYRLYQDGELVSTTALTPASPRAQSAGVDISGLSNGTYEFVGVLANSRGETSTETLTVVVEDAAPFTPKLSHDNRDKDGSFTVRADLWWGTNATSYRFLQNGAVVAEGGLSSASPSAQRASYTVAGMPVGRYEYVVEFRNAAGETESAPVTVTVAK